MLRNDPSDWVGKRGVYDAIIDRATFDRVQSMMEERASHDGRPRRHEYILSGLVYCHHCGGKMHGTAGTWKKNGKLRPNSTRPTTLTKWRSCANVSPA